MSGAVTRSVDSPLQVRRLPLELSADVSRVIVLPFDLSGRGRVGSIIQRVEGLSEEEVERELEQVLGDFAGRHKNLEQTLEEHYQAAVRIAGVEDAHSAARRRLIGSYFTMEYSFEAAALFNPSIVSHPDQSGVPEGSLRFVMSLRAVGEGHLSSTVFRTGIVDSAGNVVLDPPSPFSARASVAPDAQYLKSVFRAKLRELGAFMPTVDQILNRVEEYFSLRDLDRAIEEARAQLIRPFKIEETAQRMEWLAKANYQLHLHEDDSVGDLILFPRSDSESRGIEDMRLVRFVEEDGTVSYRGSYTAFDGHNILPMLMETGDFRTISMHTLNGAAVQNKGMALFPRRVDGHYTMCSRIDGRNLYLMMSDYVHFWESATLLAEPKYPWEYRLMGNCGSPHETSEGWLLITHGVGPMRRYSIGAMLLDLEDPFQIRGRLRTPLIAPSGGEREGYVPNVVYSCGSLIHGGKLVLPFAVSDSATRVATVELDELVDRLIQDGP